MHVMMISKGNILYDGRSWRLMKREKGLVQIMPLNVSVLHCLSNKYGVLPQYDNNLLKIANILTPISNHEDPKGSTTLSI